MKKIIAIALLFLYSGISCYSQERTDTRPRCFADQLLEQAIKKDATYKNRLDQIDREIIDYNKKKSHQRTTTDTPAPIVIPIVFFVVSNNAGVGDLSDAHVLGQLNALNNYFADYGIQFCLATETNNYPLPQTGYSQTTMGILHMWSSALCVHDVTTEQDDLLNSVPSTGTGEKITGERYLRVWVVQDILENGLPSTIGGYSSLPEGGASFNGIVMKASNFGNAATCTGCTFAPGYDQGKTLVHEVGHYLNLYHTFFESCIELTEGNSSTRGDRVIDTPPAIENFSCTPGFDSCDDPLGADDIHNYMAYGADACLYHFTPKQLERMLASIALYRSKLVSTDNLIYTGACDAGLISAVFEASNYAPCAGPGNAVSFNPVLSGVSYSWDFGDPGSPNNTSNLENPSHPYNSAANSPYTVTLTVSNGVTSSTSTTLIYVTNCTPIASTQGTWYFHINNGLNFASGAPVYDDGAHIMDNIFTEACAVQSNASGNLLFYTDGTFVYNNSHLAINPFNPILGDYNFSAHAGAVIVPAPGNPSLFYIFTKNGMENNSINAFRYHTVNVTGTTATMGSVNSSIITPSGYVTGSDNTIRGIEGVAATAACNGDYFIITAHLEPDGTYTLVVYRLNSLGNLTVVNQTPLPAFANSVVAKIEVSPDGNKILYSGTTFMSGVTGVLQVGSLLLYDFNKYTGAISNMINLDPLSIYNNMYGSSFSPDSKLVYVRNGRDIYQFNIAVPNPAGSVKKLIDGAGQGDMQLGPDNKLYIMGRRQQLAVVHRPNIPITYGGNECMFTLDGPLMEEEAVVGLPNFIDGRPATIANNTITTYAQSCFTYSFAPNVCGSTFNWNFGDTVNNTSSLQRPSHTFSGPGAYTVTLNASGTIITTQVVITGVPVPVITGNATACVTGIKQTHHSVPYVPGITVQWSIVSGSGSMSVSTENDINVNWTSLPGIVQVTATNMNGCTSTTQQEVTGYCPGDICAPNIVFDIPETATLETYQVSNSIVTQNNYRVPAGSDITLVAGSFIQMDPNAWIKNDALFLAYIEECVPPPPSPRLRMDDPDATLIAYPNPTTGVLNISGKPITEVSIFDVLGKNVYYSKFDKAQSVEIDTSMFTQGLYLVKVVSDGEIIDTIKVIRN
jgi:PKD repeat protein